MAVTTVSEHRETSYQSGAIQEPPPLRIFLTVAGILVAVALIAGGISHRASLTPKLPAMAVWAIAVAIADLLPVQLWGEVSLSMSLPVALAAGMILGPLPAALVCAMGSLDPREFRREIAPGKALYNRGQVGASVWTASVVFHSFGVPVTNWPLVLAPAAAALVTDLLVNMLFVVIPVGVRMRVSATHALLRVLGGSPIEHISGYASLGFVSILLATLVHTTGLWGLLASLAPLGLARQVFLQTERLGAAAKRLESKDRALLAAAERASQERRQERASLAGELHDDVLPALFKVHLMGQVLRQDLASGRLLDLDEDLPLLLSATEEAQEAIRAVVAGLRWSTIETEGVATTIRLFAQRLEASGSPTFILELEEVPATRVSKLLLFQIAREAMTNAAFHSRARRIVVRLWEEGGLARLMVRDDGIGFDRKGDQDPKHFGLRLIVERAEAASGRVVIDSQPGEGTTVLAATPLDIE